LAQKQTQVQEQQLQKVLKAKGSRFYNSMAGNIDKKKLTMKNH
jgi:hypothetical protein